MRKTARLILLLAVFATLLGPRGASASPLQATLTASDGTAHDWFGSAVAIDGDTAVVGTSRPDRSDAVYVFTRTGASWTQQAKLSAPLKPFSGFGTAVALSGDTILVGAPYDDDAGQYSGAAYVFVRTGTLWTQQAKLKAADTEPHHLFGDAVGVSGDSAIVGAPSDDQQAISSGSVYMFQRSGSAWSQQAELKTSPVGSQTQLGTAVAIEGDTVVAGATQDGLGSATVFVRAGSTWVHQARLVPTAFGSDGFGNSVSISGATIAVGSVLDTNFGSTGAGSVYVFVRTGTSWTQQARLRPAAIKGGDYFGVSVSVSGDTLIAGAYRDDDFGSDSGSVSAFGRSGTTWTEGGTLVPSTGTAGDQFGISVAIDGDTAIAGARLDDGGAQDTGSASVFYNTPPSAANDAFIADEDVVLDVAAPGVLANDSSPFDTLNAALITGPSRGSLTVNSNGSLRYTPAANDSGTYSFTYRACDTWRRCRDASATITVRAVNDAPVAVGDSYSTAEDVTLVVGAPGVLLNDTDLEGDALTAALVTPPASGSLTINANGSFTYVPPANFSGNVFFSYRAIDPSSASNTAFATIAITPVNDAPDAMPDAYTTMEDVTRTVAAPGVLANDSDVEGNPLTAELVTPPASGTLTLNPNGSFSYVPLANFNGEDVFAYRAKDSAGAVDTATVTITVTAVNDAPVAGDDTGGCRQYESCVIDVLANDTDLEGDALTVISLTQPSGGDAVIQADGTVRYTPHTWFKDQDTFTYRVSDGGATDVGVVTVLEIGCGEDGIDALGDTPARGAVSRTIDRSIEPLVGGIAGKDSARTLHDANCSIIVPAEDRIDDLAGSRSRLMER